MIVFTSTKASAWVKIITLIYFIVNTCYLITFNWQLSIEKNYTKTVVTVTLHSNNYILFYKNSEFEYAILSYNFKIS